MLELMTSKNCCKKHTCMECIMITSIVCLSFFPVKEVDENCFTLFLY